MNNNPMMNNMMMPNQPNMMNNNMMLNQNAMNTMMMNNGMNNGMNNNNFNNLMNNFNMNNMPNFNMNNNMNMNMNNMNPMMLQFMYNFMMMMNPNVNVNNPMNINTNLMNFINANPFFFQYFMNYQNSNNNNMNTGNNTFNAFRGDLSNAKIGILPRPNPNNPNSNQPKSFFICPERVGGRMNIMFITGTGIKTMVIAPENLPVRELFKEYIKKMGQDPAVLGKYIYFLYNGNKININEPKSVTQFGLNSSTVIMVVDTSNLLGGISP